MRRRRRPSPVPATSTVKTSRKPSSSAPTHAQKRHAGDAGPTAGPPGRSRPGQVGISLLLQLPLSPSPLLLPQALVGSEAADLHHCVVHLADVHKTLLIPTCAVCLSHLRSPYSAITSTPLVEPVCGSAMSNLILRALTTSGATSTPTRTTSVLAPRYTAPRRLPARC